MQEGSTSAGDPGAADERERAVWCAGLVQRRNLSGPLHGPFTDVTCFLEGAADDADV